MDFCYLTSFVLNICVNDARDEQIKKKKKSERRYPNLGISCLSLFLKSRVLVLVQKTVNIQKEQKEKLEERSKISYLVILLNPYSSLAIFV